MSENDKHRRAFDPGNGPTPPDHASENSGFRADPDQPLDAELLSVYLNDPEDLEPETRRRIEQELATNADTRRTLRELEALVIGLQALPDVAAPRSYHLTPELVGAPEPVKLQETRAWYVRHSETVRWATAAAAILFIFVFSADLVTNGIGPGSGDSDSADSDTEQTTLRSADGGGQSDDADASDDDAGGDASGASEAEMQPIPEEEAASDSGAAPTATPAAVEAEGDIPEDAGSGADAQEDPPSDEMAATSAEADGGEVEESEDAPVTLNAPDEAATEPVDEAVPDRDEADASGGDDTAADTGVAESQPDLFTMSNEEAGESSSDSRTVWRAVEFSLILVLAVLLVVMIILPRLERAPPGSRDRRR